MITNKTILSWITPRKLVTSNLDRKFSIDKVDKVRFNTNTLMFITKHANIGDVYELLDGCKDCVFLVDDHVYNLVRNYESNNDIILSDNPKYEFCYLTKTLNLPSRFQYEYLEEKIIGKNCQFDPGVIIGGTDFSPVLGYQRSELIQFPQMGGVKIGDNVIIKYNSMVGKGTFDYTTIGDDTMIDFNCQIGHNCQIGGSCIIAAGTIIGGSTTIGNMTTVGMGVMIRNGITIGSNVSIGMGSVVTKDIPDNTVVYGVPAVPVRHPDIFTEEGLI